MTDIWFTSDTHFYHTGALKWRKAFASVEEMNEAIATLWAACVRPGDTIYHLGDVGWWHKNGKVATLVKKLPGQKHLIYGNHDDGLKPALADSLFCSAECAKYIRVGDQKIYLHHYACLTWRSSHHGSWHLYGHSHGSLEESLDRRSCDVGVDDKRWGLAPVNFEVIKEVMKGRSFAPVDHHV